MWFKTVDGRGEIVVEGSEIKTISKHLGKEDDYCWVEYGIGPTIEGFVKFVDWGLFFIVRFDDYNNSEIYYHCEELNIRETEPWNKTVNRASVIRFLVKKLIQHYNITELEQVPVHVIESRTQSAIQDTKDLFERALNAKVEKEKYEIKELEYKDIDNNWVSCMAVLQRDNNTWTTEYYHIIIGSKGGIKLLTISYFLSDVRTEYKGEKAKGHLRFMIRY